MKLLVSERSIEIHDTDIEKAYSIPYVHSNRRKDVFKTSVKNLDFVMKLYDKDIAAAPQKIKDIYNKEQWRIVATQEVLSKKHQDDLFYDHQMMGAELAKVHDRFCFFYDTRTGKTPMSLKIIHESLQERPDEKWLILCPITLIKQAWIPDAERFFPDLTLVNLHAKDRATRMEQFKKDDNVYLMNIEAFINYREEIEKIPFAGCIVDESSTMKSTKSKFGKAAVEYSMRVKRWYLLSGSPAPNGEWEYYRQLQSIDFYGVHQSWTQFKLYFFDNVSYNPQFEKLKIKADRKEELQNLVKKYAIYVDKEDVLNLPGRSFDIIDVEMPIEIKKQYKHLKDKLYLEVENELITADNVGAKINKLRQVTSGFIINTETQEAHLISMYKFNALVELLRAQGNKQVLVWCFYRKEFEVIRELLGDSCLIINGTVTEDEKQYALDSFKQGKIQFLIANPASISHGVTLTNACTCVYFSLSHSYELWKQSIDRIYGDVRSQKNFCSYYVLISTGTIDKVLFDTVSNKGDVSYAMLNHLKKGDA